MRNIALWCLILIMCVSLYAQNHNADSSGLITNDKKNVLTNELKPARFLTFAGPIVHVCGLVVSLSSIALISSKNENNNSSKIGTGGLIMLITGGLATTIGPGISAGGAYKAEQSFNKNNIPVTGKNAGFALYGVSWTFDALGALGFLTRSRALNIIGGVGQEIFFTATMVNSSMFVANNSPKSSKNVKRSVQITPHITFKDEFVGLRIAAIF